MIAIRGAPRNGTALISRRRELAAGPKGLAIAYIGRYTYRVFTKPGELPILVEVHDKAVTREAFEHIKTIVEGEWPQHE